MTASYFSESTGAEVNRTTSPTVTASFATNSGRQDSNLRSLVPQISPHFPRRAEFGFECFRREMVGMMTRARLIESVGIAWTSRG
jgi:hypothetical protein